ncbi:TetR/AcrR family transcriptional regulator [Pseudonocardia sp. CA-107938]|uniref:TetR/AcrR family transcriptional regulator n=1 Tax=Pseudonocardia sp. CA-107938 TaxID=3240021 RepID=UPI003D8D13B8
MRVIETGRSVTADARRRQIVAAAIEVLADEGFARASFARIADQAGVASTRMISYHFADRDELMREVVSTVLGEAGPHIERFVPVDASPAAQLRGLVLGNVDYYAGHRREVAAAQEVWNGLRDAAGRPVYGLHSHELEFEMVGQVLRAGQERGEFRDFDVRFMCVALRHLLNGAAAVLVADPETDVDALGAQLVATVDRATRR